MKVLLFLAVFALATQVHNSEVTEFYRTFINNIPMDTQTKNQIMNDGLECINLATNTLINAVGKVQQDVYRKDLINVLRDVIGSAEALEKSVLPKCAQTYMQLAFYLQTHADHSQLNSQIKVQLFQAKLVQMVVKTVVNAALRGNSDLLAKDLAVLVDTAFGLIDANLPTLMEFDYSKYVPMNEEKALPLFFKGLFNGFGIYDSAKIDGTSKCVLGVVASLKTIFSNQALQRGDFYTKANTFLDSLMPLTDSFERCQKLNLVDVDTLARVLSAVKELPISSLARIGAKGLARVAYNSAANLPEIMTHSNNMGVLMLQGQYELAGQTYAQYLEAVYYGIY